MNTASTSTRVAAATDRGAEEPAPHRADDDHVRALDQLLDPRRGLPDRHRHRGRPPVRTRRRAPRSTPAGGPTRAPAAPAAPSTRPAPPPGSAAPAPPSAGSASFAGSAPTFAALATGFAASSRFAPFFTPAITSLLAASHRWGKGGGKDERRGARAGRRPYRRGGTATSGR